MLLKDYLSPLNKCRLFSSLDDQSLLSLFTGVNYRILTYEKNSIIFNEDEVCSELSIVLSGYVLIQKLDPLGKVLNIAEFTEGDTFGENLIFGDRNLFPMTVFSKTPTVILHIRKESVVELCQKSSTFLYEYLRVVSNRALSLSHKLKEVTLKTIRQKLCEFLINLYDIQKTPTVVLPFTKREWADKLGIQRPSLSRELIKMKEEGLIDYEKNLVHLLNLEEIKYELQ